MQVGTNSFDSAPQMQQQNQQMQQLQIQHMAIGNSRSVPGEALLTKSTAQDKGHGLEAHRDPDANKTVTKLDPDLTRHTACS